jgi:AAA ATPase domain
VQKERLVIKNFGPIKSVDLELGKMTILIGEQATGKSTIAKVLAVCRYFSYIVNDSLLGKPEDPFYIGLRYWEIDSYYSESTFIEYENDDYIVTVEEGIIDAVRSFDGKIEYQVDGCTSEIKHKSERFKILLQELESIKPQNSDWYDWNPGENFFRLNVKKVMDNPFFIPTERGLQSLFTLGKNINNLSDSLLEQLTKLNKISRVFQIDEVYINSLSLKYINDNGIGYTKKVTDSQFYALNNGASGYKSAIPIELPVYFYSRLEKRRRTFIVEEPELNLFPKAQKKLVEFFVENINENGHKFLLPTHSPYILSSVNNLLYAYVIGHLNDGEFKEQVKDIIPEKNWLNPEDISVYYLENGEVKDIFDREENLINTDYIDSVSSIINDEFDRLLSIEVKYNNSGTYDL